MLQRGFNVAAPGEAARASQGARGLAHCCSTFSFGVPTAVTVSLSSVSPVRPLGTGTGLCAQLYTPDPGRAQGLVGAQHVFVECVSE